jgi:hypothetical protein
MARRITTGGFQAKRDGGHTRDYVRAMCLMPQQERGDHDRDWADRRCAPLLQDRLRPRRHVARVAPVHRPKAVSAGRSQGVARPRGEGARGRRLALRHHAGADHRRYGGRRHEEAPLEDGCMSAITGREPPRILVTGGWGFVGVRLTAALAARHPDWRLDVLDAPRGAGGEEAVYRRSRRGERLDRRAPNRHPRPPRSRDRGDRFSEGPQALAWRVNLDGTLLLALQEHAPDAHLLLISSAEVHGASILDHQRGLLAGGRT